MSDDEENTEGIASAQAEEGDAAPGGVNHTHRGLGSQTLRKGLLDPHGTKDDAAVGVRRTPEHLD